MARQHVTHLLSWRTGGVCQLNKRRPPPRQDYYPATATLKARRMSGRVACQDLKQFLSRRTIVWAEGLDRVSDLTVSGVTASDMADMIFVYIHIYIYMYIYIYMKCI